MSLQASLVADLWGKLPAASQSDPGLMDEALSELVAALQSPDLARTLANQARDTPEGDALARASLELLQAQGAMRALIERAARREGGAPPEAADSSHRSGIAQAEAADELEAAAERLRVAQAGKDAAAAALAAVDPNYAAAYRPASTAELHRLLQGLRERGARLRAAPGAPAALLCMMEIPADQDGAQRRLVAMLVNSEREAAVPVEFDGLHALAVECRELELTGQRGLATLRHNNQIPAGAAAAQPLTNPAEQPSPSPQKPAQRSLDEILADLDRLWWQPLMRALQAEGIALGSLHLSSHGLSHYLPFAAVVSRAAGENLALHQWPGLPYLRAAWAKQEGAKQEGVKQSGQTLGGPTPAGSSPLAGTWQIGHDCAWDHEEPLPMVAVEAHWLLEMAAGQGQRVHGPQDLVRGAAALALCSHGTRAGANAQVRMGRGGLDAAYVMERALSAPLVLLPACHAGETADDHGGNALGLAAGFLFAGSGVVVGSSKSVPDTIMPWFSTLLAWHVLHDGLTPYQAAQRARQEMVSAALIDDPGLEPYRNWMRQRFAQAMAQLQPGGDEHEGLQNCLKRQREQGQQQVLQARAQGKEVKRPEDVVEKLEGNWPWRGQLSWVLGDQAQLGHAAEQLRRHQTERVAQLLFSAHDEEHRRESIRTQMRELGAFVVVYGLGQV